MMRIPATIACLFGLYLVCGSLAAQPREPVLPDGLKPKAAHGVGPTEAKAKAKAYDNAVKAITALMKEHAPPLTSFAVDRDYLEKHVFVDAGRPGKDVKEQVEGVEHVSKEWILTFKTDYNWWKDIVRRDQEAQRFVRAKSRETVASHIMLGLAALLITGFGYVRLDEFTKGRYTTWLRVASVGLVSSVIAGWWWMVNSQ